MSTLANRKVSGNGSNKPLTSIRAARAVALHEILKQRRGVLLIDAGAYNELREDGWSRSDVDRAVDDLVSTERASLSTRNATLRIHLASAESEVQR